MIPAKYNLRNLRVRWVTTLMTVLGTVLVVWASVLSFGLTEGLEHCADDHRQQAGFDRAAKGFAGRNVERPRTKDHPPGEHARRHCPRCERPADVLGRVCHDPHATAPRTTAARRTSSFAAWSKLAAPCGPAFQIIEGRDIKPGVNEAITSRAMAERFENLGHRQQARNQ